jgi:hypothetical protein
MSKAGAYTATGENPIVLCSYGKTPGKAMKAMGKLVDEYLKRNETFLVLGINSTYEDDEFCLNVTISHWG